MSVERNFTDQEYELLSAYLDGALSESERADLETRLLADDGLRRELEALRQTVNLIGSVPPIKAPRNFTLTPNMVRVRPERWLIFPTSAAFSGIVAAAATILILIGAGLLLLRGNVILNSSTTSLMQPAAAEIQQETGEDIAILPTQIVLTVEKTADDNVAGRVDETASALSNLSSVATTPTPATTTLDGFAMPESSAPTDGSGGGGIVPAEPLSPTASIFFYAPSTQPTIDEEQEQPDAMLQIVPLEATRLAASTMVMAAPPPAAADTGSQAAAGEAANANAQQGAAGVTADQIMMATGTPNPTLNRELAMLLTATAPAVGQASATETPTPLPPTPTAMPTATVTMTATPEPSATLISTTRPTVTPEPVDETAEAPAAPTDFAPLMLLAGVLLLVIAGITTFVRRRGR
jgi:anti-sigma factor RsiW